MFDRFDGDIMTHGTIDTNISDTDKTIILNREKTKGKFGEERTALNRRIAQIDNKSAPLTPDEFSSILMTGTVPDRLTSIFPTTSTPAVFYETRACFPRSACINKAEGIAYPAIDLK